MRVFITGATGLIGQRLVPALLNHHDEVVVLTRSRATAVARVPPEVTIVEGDPSHAGDWQRELLQCDAVVHLAGASIAGKRWTAKYKQALYDSRIKSTHQIAQTLQRANRPMIFISGSAIGYYGDAGNQELNEQSPAGQDFLAKLCVAWESEATKATTPDMRVVLLRTGVVLDRDGGALPLMMRPFRFFAGGPIGWGGQWMSWIHWADLVGLIRHALVTDAMTGPLNAVSPSPVRNIDFAKAIGRAMGRPALLPMPKFALRIGLGEVANAIVASQRVVPNKAMQTGFQFSFPHLREALDDLIAAK